MSEGFDLRTEIRDPSTGKVITSQPYFYHVSHKGRYFERPPGSGKYYTENGQPFDPEKQAEQKLVTDTKVK